MHTKKYPFTQNREYSWLKFNQRVLEEAADPCVELLERLKFLAIFSSNLDEFFMVRAGSLMDMALVDNHQYDAKSGLSPKEQLALIFKETRQLYLMRDHVAKNLMKTLRELQIQPVPERSLTKKQQKQVTRIFETQLMPLLAVQIIDLHHPFPFLINKEQYIFFEMQENNKRKYGLVPLPDYLPRIVYLNDEKTEYMLSETIILSHLNSMFPKAKIPFKAIIRVTRNADINLNLQDIEDDEDYRQYMKKILKRRNRLSPIRLETSEQLPPEALRYLCAQLHISQEQVFVSRHAPLDPGFMFSLIDKLPADLKTALTYKPYDPQPSSLLRENKPLIPQILHHDVLLSYPYQNIDIFIALLREAASSPDVISIKITIYRLASQSKILRYLCRAAENGKDVLVLMELRARFDEQNNIQAAERLEEAGCTVIYGFEDYKVHSKLMQITLKNKGGIQTITQIGTGNYNEKTSKLYTDFSYITANPVIGKDAAQFFQNMNISNLNGSYEKLIVSPSSLKPAIIKNLDEQIALAKEGKPASADFKMNSLTDLELIAKLAEASQAGVKIRMIVRGICCLLPGIEGFTENIEVHSIVGRYLEHARIYIFGSGKDAKVYISSADFMTRNTERRVEVGVPIENEKLKKELIDYFNLQFSDDVKGRMLMPTGYYTKLEANEEPIDAQEKLMELAIQEAESIEDEPEKPSGKLFSNFLSFFKKKSS
jgi:polyphosphate kinase